MPYDPQTPLSPHFKLWEATASETASRHGIDNTPGASEVYGLKWTATYLMEPIRERFGRLRVTSGYRSPELNAKIHGSSSTSAHKQGLAFDFVPYETLTGSTQLVDVVRWVVGSDLPYDQVILEYNDWIHIGAAHPPGFHKERHEALMKFEGSRYLPFQPSDPRIR